MIRINPALNLDTLAADFARRGRLQIRDFLVAEDAEAVHEILDKQTPWWLVYNVGNRVEEVSPERVAGLSRAQLQEILMGVKERAKTQYQFLYNSYPIVATYFNPALPKLPVLGFYEFLNRPSTLEFLRKLTGRPDIRWADAQATLYRPGNFLKSHSDEEPHQNRRAVAFIFNFTKLWERDWGGYLQFFNEAHDIEQAFRPIFNALNIFAVPQDHSVSVVSPFAYGRRYAITGWLRTDAPPAGLGHLTN